MGSVNLHLAKMKLPTLFMSILVFLAMSPPANSTPIFLVPSSDPIVAVGALAGGLLLAFKGLLLGAAFGGNRNRGGHGRLGHRGRRLRCRRCRGKRQTEQEELIDEEEETLEPIFVQIEEDGLTGCFQRLLCDIAADQDTFAEDEQLLAIEEVDVETVEDPTAKSVIKSLQEAEAIGLKGSIETCEQTFNQCQLTGKQMKEQIHQVLVQENETLQ